VRSPGMRGDDLELLVKDERIDRTTAPAPARSASLMCSGSPRDVTPRSISRDRDPFDIQNKAQRSRLLQV
jgi:hypothetical protein